MVFQCIQVFQEVFSDCIPEAVSEGSGLDVQPRACVEAKCHTAFAAGVDGNWFPPLSGSFGLRTLMLSPDSKRHPRVQSVKLP